MILADTSAATMAVAPPISMPDHPLRRQLVAAFRLLAGSALARRLGWLGLGVLLVVAASTYGQIRLNQWNGDFYDALEQRQIPEFLRQSWVYAVICGFLMVVVVSQTWLQEHIKVRLREWLTHELIDQWLVPKRAYRLQFAGEIGQNPDQRIEEDAKRLTELTAELGVGLLQASLLLACFVGVLWVLSKEIVFGQGDTAFTIPGYMVWWALAYAFGGSWLAWRVGRPLVVINAARYGRDAELRFALVRINENAEGMALHGSEQDERAVLDRHLGRVVETMVALANGLARLAWVTSGYGWFVMVAPILAAAPGYFGGSLSFGGLMMVVGGFYQVQQALRWFVDNFSRIADWRATLGRVMTFHEALEQLHSLADTPQRIEVGQSPERRLLIDDLQIAMPRGRASLSERHLELGPGERLRIVGKAGSGKSTLFRALAGLWDAGSGRVMLPPRAEIDFMTEQPYLPLGTLRTVLTFPALPAAVDDATLTSALERVELGHLRSSLDEERRWDHSLALGEQQKLAFARLLLRRPAWIFLDAPMSAVDPEDRAPLWSLMREELAASAIVLVTRHETEDNLEAQTAVLTCTPNGWKHRDLTAEPRARQHRRGPAHEIN